MSAISTIHEHDRDLPSPIPRVSRLPSRPASWVAKPLSRPDQPSFLGSGARCGFHRSEQPRRDCSQRDFLPRPRGSGTFCRERVVYEHVERAAVRPDSSVRTARRTMYASRSLPGLGPLAPPFSTSSEAAGGAAPPGARNAHPLRAHRASPLARDPPPAILLARDLPAGPLPVLPREEERDRQSPRCLPSWAALLRI